MPLSAQLFHPRFGDCYSSADVEPERCQQTERNIPLISERPAHRLPPFCRGGLTQRLPPLLPSSKVWESPPVRSSLIRAQPARLISTTPQGTEAPGDDSIKGQYEVGERGTCTKPSCGVGENSISTVRCCWHALGHAFQTRIALVVGLAQLLLRDL